MSSPLRFAVIGNPVNQSLSPVIHQQFAKQFGVSITYDKIQGNERIIASQIGSFLGEGGRGLNITAPFKSLAYECAERITERSKLSKTVNTLWRDNNLLCGDNTDGIGFLRDLCHYIDPSHKRVLILGAGGAARAILPSILEYTNAITVANRTQERALTLQKDFPQITCNEMDNIVGTFDLIINATSASLHQETVILPQLIIQQAQLCYDLSYLTYGHTPFVLLANKLGCAAVDGLGMLVEQAAEGFFIWHQLKPEVVSVKQHLQQMQLGFKKV